MRGPFLVAMALVAGCATPLSERADPRLPGLPVVAPGGDRGPVHRQRLVAITSDRVVLLERVRADGRPVRVDRVTVDPTGRVVARTPLSPSTPLPPRRTGRALPARIGDLTLRATRERGTIALRLGDGHRSVVVGRLADAARLAIGPLVTGPGKPPDLAGLSWRAGRGAIDVEGIAVVDLRRGRAHLALEAGLADHQKGDEAAARRHFRAALALDPTYADAAYDLACVLVHLGRRKAALTWLRLAFRLAPRRLRVLAAGDPDLDPIRQDPGYRALARPRPPTTLRIKP